MVPIVAALVQAGLGLLGNAVASKGKEFIEDKLNVDLTKMLGSEEGKIKLQQLQYEYEATLQKFAIDKENQVIEKSKLAYADTASARDMQKQALQQTDVFSKRFTPIFASAWSTFAVVYIFFITFGDIPLANQRFADTILGFILGTVIATILNFFFGSSQSSKDKTALMSEAIKGIKEGP